MELKVAYVCPHPEDESSGKDEFYAGRSLNELKTHINAQLPNVRVDHPQKKLLPNQAGGLMELFATIIVSTQIPIKLIDLIKAWVENKSKKINDKSKIHLKIKRDDGTEIEIESSDKKEIKDWLDLVNSSMPQPLPK